MGKRGVANGVAEVKNRETGERVDVALDEVAAWLVSASLHSGSCRGEKGSEAFLDAI